MAVVGPVADTIRPILTWAPAANGSESAREEQGEAREHGSS